jgi:hypothetical protein
MIDLAMFPRELVYIYGPYTSSPEENTRKAIDVFHRVLAKERCFPFCPHLFHYAQAVQEQPYDTWMQLDIVQMRMMARYSTVVGAVFSAVRIPGESKGAELEHTELVRLKAHSYSSIDQWEAAH